MLFRLEVLCYSFIIGLCIYQVTLPHRRTTRFPKRVYRDELVKNCPVNLCVDLNQLVTKEWLFESWSVCHPAFSHQWKAEESNTIVLNVVRNRSRCNAIVVVFLSRHYSQRYQFFKKKKKATHVLCVSVCNGVSRVWLHCMSVCVYFCKCVVLSCL